MTEAPLVWMATPAIDRVSGRTFLIQRIDDPFGSAGPQTTIVQELRDGVLTEALRDERSGPHRLRIEAIDDTDVRFSFEPTMSPN